MTTIITGGYSDNKHAWIQEFLPVAGEGVQAQLPENSSVNVLSLVLNFFLQFYSGLSIVYLKENYNFPGFQRGPNIFQGWSTIFQGVQHFPGGLNAVLYRNQ